MTLPKRKRQVYIVLFFTIVAGFLGLTLIASIHPDAAWLAAIGFIGFAAISLLIAVFRG